MLVYSTVFVAEVYSTVIIINIVIIVIKNNRTILRLCKFNMMIRSGTASDLHTRVCM